MYKIPINIWQHIRSRSMIKRIVIRRNPWKIRDTKKPKLTTLNELKVHIVTFWLCRKPFLKLTVFKVTFVDMDGDDQILFYLFHYYLPFSLKTLPGVVPKKTSTTMWDYRKIFLDFLFQIWEVSRDRCITEIQLINKHGYLVPS